VPCVKVCPHGSLVLRVPFRKSGGGGTYVNAWTVTIMVKFRAICQRPLLSTGGWDQYTQMQDGDEPAQLVLSDDGALGRAAGKM